MNLNERKRQWASGTESWGSNGNPPRKKKGAKLLGEYKKFCIISPACRFVRFVFKNATDGMKENPY